MAPRNKSTITIPPAQRLALLQMLGAEFNFGDREVVTEQHSLSTDPNKMIPHHGRSTPERDL